jgi:hypothetical protein
MAYNIQMALQALTSAIDLFSTPTARQPWPAAGSVDREFREEMKVHIAKAMELLNEKRTSAIDQKRAIKASFKALAADSHQALQQGVAQLSETIRGFEALIEQSNAQMILQQAEADASLARIAEVDVESAKLARGLGNKFFEIGGEFHNETVEFYYFLLALRAEYDPEARGGPSFDDPKALGDYLREQMKA